MVSDKSRISLIPARCVTNLIFSNWHELPWSKWSCCDPQGSDKQESQSDPINCVKTPPVDGEIYSDKVYRKDILRELWKQDIWGIEVITCINNKRSYSGCFVVVSILFRVVLSWPQIFKQRNTFCENLITLIGPRVEIWIKWGIWYFFSRKLNLILRISVPSCCCLSNINLGPLNYHLLPDR